MSNNNHIYQNVSLYSSDETKIGIVQSELLGKKNLTAAKDTFSS